MAGLIELALIKILDSVFNNDKAIGKRGERLTAQKLNWVDFFGYKGKILQNVYLPKDNGETSEIDLLYITQVGIFVIESKNYSGYIFGTDTNQKWTMVLYGGKDFIGRKTTEKHQFYNPIKQNQTHIKWLKNYLQSDIQTISLIVFSERCELKEISLSSSKDVIVCNRGKVPSAIKECFEDYPTILSEEQINEVFNKLLPLTNQDKETKEKHIQDIQNKQNSLVCPLCKGKLVLRTATKGSNAGNQFYGCSNYPKCKYTRNI